MTVLLLCLQRRADEATWRCVRACLVMERRLTGSRISLNTAPLDARYRDGPPRICTWLLEQGASLDWVLSSDGAELVAQTAAHSSSDMLEWLLQHGADGNALASYDNSALAGAAVVGHLRRCQLLLAHGADINNVSGDGHINPPQFAARCGQYQVCAFLIEEGADVAAKDPRGRLSLRLAKLPAVAQLLFAHCVPIAGRWKAVARSAWRCR